MYRSETHAAALEYARRFGWYVFPLHGIANGVCTCGKPFQPKGAPEREGFCKSPGKHPRTFKGKDEATLDEKLINLWWSNWPDANIGIATEPSKLVVLDVDVSEYIDADGHKQYKQGRESLKEFDAHLDRTLTAVTGSGGLHIIYTVGDEHDVVHRIDVRPGLDLIARGYIVAAPSRHVSGGVYTWHDQVQPARLPKVLRDVARLPKPQKVQPTEARAAIVTGGRNNAMFKLASALREQGLGREALAGAMYWENQQRCRPPLAEDELKVLIDNVLERTDIRYDVALSAAVETDIHKALAKPEDSDAMWIGDVAKLREPPMRWYPTGFTGLDNLTGGGIASRQVFGIIGPPSTGKSAFVDSLVEHLEKQIPVLHFSTELPRREMMVRYAALKMGFPWRDGMKGYIPDEDMIAAVADMRVKLIGADNFDRVNPLAYLHAKAEAMRAQSGIAPVIVVDYVQMLARGSADQTRGKVGELTMGLRIMSQTLDCPVIAVFSSRRDFYSTAVKEKMRELDDPTAYLAAAKESGDIEFDCATLVYLDLDNLHEGQPKPARVAVARCRVGEPGFAGARADLAIGKWWGDDVAAKEIVASVQRKSTEGGEGVLDRDIDKFLEVIDKMDGRPWGDIRIALQMSEKRANAARARLTASMRIQTVKELHYDHNGRGRNVDVIRKIPNSLPASNVGTP